MIDRKPKLVRFYSPETSVFLVNHTMKRCPNDAEMQLLASLRYNEGRKGERLMRFHTFAHKRSKRHYLDDTLLKIRTTLEKRVYVENGLF